MPLLRSWVLIPLVAGLVMACQPAPDPPDILASPPPTTPADEGPPTPPVTPTPVAPAQPTDTPTPAQAEEPAAPAVAQDPDGLAAQLMEAERAIRSAETSRADLARLGHLQQVAYRMLATRPEWRDAVFTRIPENLHSTVRANADATAALRAMITPRSELPAWRIVEPAPADELLGHYREAEAAFGVPWPYLAAIHLVETRMGRIRGTSIAGAQGPMQFMPGTWEAYGEGDVNDNRDAILAAGRYLSANNAPADMDNALFRYNRDTRYVAAIKAYAEQMVADERAYQGYYHWQVYFLTPEGDVWLPAGYVKDPS